MCLGHGSYSIYVINYAHILSVKEKIALIESHELSRENWHGFTYGHGPKKKVGPERGMEKSWNSMHILNPKRWF